MPPKGSKRKVATPEPEAAPSPKKPTTPKAKGAPKKQPASPGRSKQSAYMALDHDPITPVDVTYEGPALHAKMTKTGIFSHALKLEASRAFTLLETVVLDNGPHEGRQAIIIVPAKSFPFMKLPDTVRQSIYEYYFAQNGVVGEAITFDGKRAKSKEVYAKTYAAGSNYRVGLVTASKQIYEEASSYLFTTAFSFESTANLVDFISQIPSDKRQLLRSVAVKNYVKASARNAMHLLSEARDLQRLHFDRGVYTNEVNPRKAAKAFKYDAYKFLEVMGSVRGDKLAGMEVITFGRLAFTSKDGEKKVHVAWPSAQVEEFKDELRKELEK